MKRLLSQVAMIPLRIALIFAAVSAVWIYFSDRILAILFNGPAVFTRLQTYKGLFFISVTAVLIYVLIRNNITELAMTTLHLQASEEKYRDLVEHINDWVWEIDEDFIFTYSNPIVENILGYSVDEIIGKKPFDLMSVDEAQRATEIIQGFANTRSPFGLFENTFIHKTGRETVLEISGLPVFDNEGKFSGYRGIDRDVTERRLAEELAKARDLDVRNAYVSILSAVTGDRFIIMTDDEIQAVLGEPITEAYSIDSYKDLSTARTRILSMLASKFSDDESLQELMLAASEAISNAVKHAQGGIYQGYQSEQAIQLMVSDSGPGIDFSVLPKAALIPGFSTKQSLGVGFSVMLELSNRVILATRPGRTIVLLEKCLTPVAKDTFDLDKYASID